VVDASAAFAAAVAPAGFDRFDGDVPVAPPLLWPEVRSALYEAASRGEISSRAARESLRAIESGPIRPRTHARLGRRAWEIADRLGWMKTYDAEYLALAELLGCRILTLDSGIRDAARRLAIAVTR